MNKLLTGLAIIMASTAFTAQAVEMKQETGSIRYNGNSLRVAASTSAQCSRGGVQISAYDKHVINSVYFWCLSDKQVDTLISALQDAKETKNNFK
ncbi:hypothetical protein [Endozoicomonas sp.]|uniref:hypothetical protein n=1 Tax=Endozoicomonas sp. TaxID=1892382 RepID=UPI003839D5B5